MKYLLDTHTYLWYLAADERLPIDKRKLIENAESKIYISSVSLWEISTKHAIKKLELDRPLQRVFELVEENMFEKLEIANEHLLTYVKLPFHHRDPFDRLLIAQAKTENLTIITKDEDIKLYKVKTIW